MSEVPPSKDKRVASALFNPIQAKILKMCLANDDRVCSFYSKELFESINLADVFRKGIRIKLSRLLNLDYDFVRDVVTKADKKVIIKSNGKKAKIDIYRIDKNWKDQVRELLVHKRDEVKKTSS